MKTLSITNYVVKTGGLQTSFEVAAKSFGDLNDGCGLDYLSKRFQQSSDYFKESDKSLSEMLRKVSKGFDHLRIKVALKHFDAKDIIDLPDNWRIKNADVSVIETELQQLAEFVYTVHKSYYDVYKYADEYSDKVAALMVPKKTDVTQALNKTSSMKM